MCCHDQASVNRVKTICRRWWAKAFCNLIFIYTLLSATTASYRPYWRGGFMTPSYPALFAKLLLFIGLSLNCAMGCHVGYCTGLWFWNFVQIVKNVAYLVTCNQEHRSFQFTSDSQRVLLRRTLHSALHAIDTPFTFLWFTSPWLAWKRIWLCCSVLLSDSVAIKFETKQTTRSSTNGVK